MLFSAIAITLVAMVLIPLVVVPEYDAVSVFKKPVARQTSGVEPVQTAPAESSCGLSVYGLDCAVADYLEKNAAFTSQSGKAFCDYEMLRDSGSESYLDILCEEFYLDGGKIYIGSGTAGPAKLTRENGQITAIWRPRDGSSYTPDMQANFPADLQGMNPDIEKMEQINRERAKTLYNADFDYQVEKTTDAVCAHDFDCATPGEFLMLSRCRFTSMCLAGKCAIVCPNLYRLQQ